MLHDLFLYNWRNTSKHCNCFKDLHAFSHPKIALKNSLKLFDLNKKEQDIILSHMWPLTIIPPKSKEGLIITFVDKYSAINETIEYISNKLHKKSFYRFAYVFLSLFIFRMF